MRANSQLPAVIDQPVTGVRSQRPLRGDDLQLWEITHTCGEADREGVVDVGAVDPRDNLGNVEVGEPYRLNRLNPAIAVQDRKSTRLNSSHVRISYAVFCL